jgi:response regulator of citrate/malate metabolism
MHHTSHNKVSVLLLCPPGLTRVSLVTAVNAFSVAIVVDKATDVDSAVSAAKQIIPDVLLVDGYFFGDSVSSLLERMQAAHLPTLRVVLAGTSAQKARFIREGAHFALDYGSFNQQFPQVLDVVQANLLDS